MAYYTAFINAWNAGVVPANCTGTAFAGLTTTQQRLTALNGWIFTGAIPSTFTVSGFQIMQCLDGTEFMALSTDQQSKILQVCAMPQVFGGPNTAVGKMFATYYSGVLGGPTITALSALAKAIVEPWWQSQSYPRAFDLGDCTAAGVS